MLYYFEDIFVINFLLTFLPIISLVKLLSAKKKKIGIVVATIIGIVVLFLIQNLYIKNSIYFLLIFPLLQVLFMENKNIVEFGFKSLFFTIIFAYYCLILLLTNFTLHRFNVNNNFLISASILIISYYFLNNFIDFIKKSISNNFSKEININGNKIKAIIDTGNKIKYNGKEVVVLSCDYNLVKTDKFIEVSTINSIKKYPLYYINELCILDKHNKYFYDVPAIVESNNSNAILPLKYN